MVSNIDGPIVIHPAPSAAGFFERELLIPPHQPSGDKPAGETFGPAVSTDISHQGLGKFVRMWASQKGRGAAKGPPLADWWTQFMANTRNLPKHLSLPADYHTRPGTGAPSPDPVADLINRPIDFADPVPGQDHTIEDGHEISPKTAVPDDLAVLIKDPLFIIEAALTIGAPKVEDDGSLSFVGKGLKEILEPVAERVDGFLLYAVARGAWELGDQGGGRLFAKSETAAMASLENREFKQAFAEYREWNSHLLAFAQGKGLIAETGREAWRLSEFTPLWRVGRDGGDEPDVHPGPHSGPDNGSNDGGGGWHGFKVLTGGAMNPRDVLGNVILNAMFLIGASLANQERLEVLRLAEERGGVLVPIPDGGAQDTIRTEEAWQAFIEGMGIGPGDMPPAEALRYLELVFRNHRSFLEFIHQRPADDNVLSLRRAGKTVRHEIIDPNVLRSLVEMNRQLRYQMDDLRKHINQNPRRPAFGLSRRDEEVGHLYLVTLIDKRTGLKRTVMVTAGSKVEAERIAERHKKATEKVTYSEKAARPGG